MSKALAGWVALCLLAPAALAVSPGELELRSYQDQRLDAVVALGDTEGLKRRHIRVGLASREDFARVGIAWAPILKELRFKIRQGEDGSFHVEVTSKKPIAAPSLSFILDVRWPQGRALNEYVLALAPAEEEGTRVAEVAPAAVAPAPRMQSQREARQQAEREARQRAERDAKRRAEREARQRAERTARPSSPAATRGSYKVKRGDRLWTLAHGYRADSSLSMQQAILAWLRANPHAFIQNNVNLMRAGVQLSPPSEAELRRLSKAEALAEVRRQNQAFADWRRQRSGGAPQFDARRGATGSQTARTPRPEAELKLLASEATGDAKTGSGASGASGAGDLAAAAATRAQLAMAKEALDQSRRSDTELRSRLGDLSEQLGTLNELIALRDEQLAALRAELAKVEPQGQRTRRQEDKSALEDWQERLQEIIDQVMKDPTLLAIIGGGVVAFFLLLFLLRRPARRPRDRYAYDMGDAGRGYSDPPVAEPPQGASPGEAPPDEEDDIPSMLDLARAYIEMGDIDGARRLLQEIVQTGNDRDAAEARELLAKLGG